MASVRETPGSRLFWEVNWTVNHSQDQHIVDGLEKNQEGLNVFFKPRIEKIRKIFRNVSLESKSEVEIDKILLENTLS